MKNEIYYIWPHDFRWRNNVLGQRIIMLSSLGSVKIIHRKGKRLPVNLNCNYELVSLGIDSKYSDYLSLLTYIAGCIYYLSSKKIFSKINKNTVIYTNFEYSIIVGIYSKKVLSMRWIADFFDDPHRNFLNVFHRGASKWRCMIEKSLLKIYKHFLIKADLVICNSPNLKIALGHDLLKAFNLDKTKMVAVPSGVCLEYLSTCIQDTSLNNAVSLMLKQKNVWNKYIYFVGHLNRYTSGIYELLNAVELLKKRNINYHVILAGICKRKEKEWLNRLLNELNLQSTVNYIGIVDQRLSYMLMKRSAICICPYQTENRSDYETAYPIKLLEFLAIGVPTIAVETTVTRKIINDFGYGVLLPKCSVSNIVSGIELIANYDQSKKTEVRVPDTYRWENINRKLQKSIKKKLH